MFFSWLYSLWSRQSRASRSRGSEGRTNPRLEALEERVVPTTFTVTSLADFGNGTLRSAIAGANAVAAGLPADINFNIGPGPQMIAVGDGTIAPGTVRLPGMVPGKPLDALTRAITIDGAASRTNPTQVVQIDGICVPNQPANPEAASAFQISAGGGGSVIRNLTITDWLDNGIWLLNLPMRGAATTIDQVKVGADPTGTIKNANGLGILINGSSRVTVENSVVSGNATIGIMITGSPIAIDGGSPSVDDDIINNYIGTNAAGDAAIPNGTSGIFVSGACIVTIPSNVVSGNDGDGINLAAMDSTLRNNYIGTDASGTIALGNGAAGVADSAGKNSIIGNLISGNAAAGLKVSSADDSILSNTIGPAVGGKMTLVFPKGITNQPFGIVLTGAGALANTIGRGGPVQVISGNTEANLRIIGGADANMVFGNLIGTDSSGNNTLLLAAGSWFMTYDDRYQPAGWAQVPVNRGLRYNQPGDGVQIIGSNDNHIGNAGFINRNIIAGNIGNGILIEAVLAGPMMAAIASGNFMGATADSTGLFSDFVRFDACFSQFMGTGAAENVRGAYPSQ